MAGFRLLTDDIQHDVGALARGEIILAYNGNFTHLIGLEQLTILIIVAIVVYRTCTVTVQVSSAYHQEGMND
jgi:hypothetical protein